jgi:hypothetical protein
MTKLNGLCGGAASTQYPWQIRHHLVSQLSFVKFLKHNAQEIGGVADV